MMGVVLADATFDLYCDSCSWKKGHLQHSLCRLLFKPSTNWGEIDSQVWVWLCGTSFKKINSSFKDDGEINSNEDMAAPWADEVYYYPAASAVATDDCYDTDEDKAATCPQWDSGAVVSLASVFISSHQLKLNTSKYLVYETVSEW